MVAERAPRIALFAGEASGDALGAELMAAIAQWRPGTRFVGVGGPRMAARGLASRYPFERLAMNGLGEPLARLPALLGLRRRLLAEFRAHPPDAFVGVDFNVFNLSLARALRAQSIPTAQYVSPSVYAWRRGRIRTVARSVDRLLTLFPFEPPLYAGSGVDARYVGHPLAERLKCPPRREAARRRVGVAGVSRPVLAVLPGSRRGEVRRHGPLFLRAAARFTRLTDAESVLVAVPEASHARQVESILRAMRTPPPVRVLTGGTWDAIAAADVVLTKSGTATLETLLIGRPMVVSYRLGPGTALVVRRLLRTPYVALPNLLAGEREVPELLQEAASPEALATSLLGELERARDPWAAARRARLAAALRVAPAENAAAAVLELVDAARGAAGGATPPCSGKRLGGRCGAIRAAGAAASMHEAERR